MSNSQLIIEVPLITVGMTWIAWLVYKQIREHFGKKDKGWFKERTLFCFFAGVICFLVAYLWLVPQVITGEVVKKTVSTQYENCKNTHTDNGELTSEQCEYFQNVLNGKYNESEQPFDISHYLGN